MIQHIQLCASVLPSNLYTWKTADGLVELHEYQHLQEQGPLHILFPCTPYENAFPCFKAHIAAQAVKDIWNPRFM